MEYLFEEWQLLTYILYDVLVIMADQIGCRYA